MHYECPDSPGVDRCEKIELPCWAIWTDNSKEFCSRAILTWANAPGVKLFLIEPGKPNQNAYIDV